MIYTHVLRELTPQAKSPLDSLEASGVFRPDEFMAGGTRRDPVMTFSG